MPNTLHRELWKVFCTFGLPKIIQSDNGPEFVNDILRALVRITGIDHRFISPYNPRADGKVERCNRYRHEYHQEELHGREEDWPLFVPFAQLSFNNKVSQLTGSSPFSLMFGRALNEPKDYTDVPAGPIQYRLTSTTGKHIRRRYCQSSILLSLLVSLISKQSMIARLDKHRRLLMQGALPNGAIVMLD